MTRTRRYVERAFHGQSDTGKIFGQRVIEEMSFERCYFQGEALSLVNRPEKRTIVRNVVLEDCKAVGCTLYSAILDTIRVRNLKMDQSLQVWAAAFRHVKLEGRMPSLMVSPYFDAMLMGTPRQRAFEEANRAFYGAVDWALDITEAEFPDVELRGIPARLVRADPDISAIVTREKAQASDVWREEGIELELRMGLDRMHEVCDDVVLVAATGHPRYGRLRDGLKRLLDVGIAEPVASP